MPGRGGAGNIEAANQQISRDLEANRTHAEDESAKDGATTSPIAQALQQDTQPAEFAHTGRGGAGNFYSPSGLVSKGDFSRAEASTMGRSSEVSIGAASGRLQGRGGAGNFLQPTNEIVEGRDPLLESKQQEAFERVARDVEDTLERPQKAHLDISRERER
ncbi:MAG: hypothetical protein M1828_005882 [Chrysothrix sp. TS-e1954]|nr:MAG: hypothetical protein M1828_005882 [Chrysothrix sp. TS-e1954]